MYKRILQGSILILVFVLAFSCTAQNILDKKILINVENVSYKQAIKIIAEASNVEFAYNDDALPQNKTITLQFSQIRLRHVLYYLLEDTPLSYRIIGDQIVIYRPDDPQPKKITLSGYILDSLSGEKIIGANIYFVGTNLGTTTNLYGFYSLTVNPGEWALNVSYLGYKKFQQRISLDQDLRKNIFLSPALDLDEVDVVADNYYEHQVGVNAARESFVSRDFEMIPAVAGESDIIKLTQNLPGVQSGTDGLGGLHVRGGDPGQNLVMLDGVKVYNPFHTAGFFSVYNPSVVKSITLYKSAFPARFSGLGSSVLDVRTKDGNNQDLKAEAGISLLALNLSLEGPIQKDKSSFIITARRTYIDPWVRAITRYLNQRENKKGYADYYFFDINAKANFNIGKNDKLYFSWYEGQDKFEDQSSKESEFGLLTLTNNKDNYLKWGNDIGTVRWNHLVNNKLFANTTLNYSNFVYNSLSFTEDIQKAPDQKPDKTFNLGLFRSKIQDISLKTDFDFNPTPAQKFKAGFGITYHRFQPLVFGLDENSPHSSDFTILNGEVNNLDTLIRGENIDAIETNIYIEDEINLTDNILLNLGLNTTFFGVQGTTYLTMQPRLNINFIVNKNVSLYIAYDNLSQNLHLLSNAGFNLPNDLWIPATSTIGPLKVIQTSLGVHSRLGKGFELKIEGYYKQMENLVSFEEGASFISNGNFLNGGLLDARNWEDKISKGEGNSKGIEFTLKRTTGNFRGWIAYTYASSDRQFDKVNFGKIFPYRYDRKSTINLVGSYNLGRNVEFLVNFYYGTGQPYSIASSKYITEIPGETGPVEILNWPATNNSRLDPYHRLDLGVNFRSKRSWGSELFYIGLINVYDRRNTLYVQLVENPDNPSEKKFVKTTLLPILPSFSYKANF